MFRLLFGITIGAALMYILDPQKGGERRQMISDRVRSGADKIPEDAKAKITEVKDQAAATVGKARGQAEATISDTQQRFGQTVEQARADAEDLAESAKDRARSTITSNQPTDANGSSTSS